MKFAVLPLILSFLLVEIGRASHPIVVEIKTDEAGPHYSVNTQSMTAREVEEYLKNFIEKFTSDGIYRDGIFVRPDMHTTFQTVFALVRRIEAAGVKRCEVFGQESSNGSTIEQDSLVVGPGSFNHLSIPASPPIQAPK